MDVLSEERKDSDSTLVSSEFIYRRVPRENPLTNFHKNGEIGFGPH